MMEPTSRKLHPVVILLSAAEFIDTQAFAGGVSALSFIQSYVTLTSANVPVVVATYDGSSPSFFKEDDKCEQWLRSSSNIFTNIKSIDDLDGLVLPHSPGGYQDFIHPNSKCARLVEAFYNAGKPICSIGLGITALMGAKRATDGKWLFAGKHITTISNLELCKYPFFSKLPVVPEDFIRDSGAQYTGAAPGQLHVVIDGKLVSAQNVQSTTLATHNFVWLCKYG